MIVDFDPSQPLIIVTARIKGPLGDHVVQLALDTGATTTLVRSSRLVSLGYDTDTASERAKMVTGSGVETVPRLKLQQFEALGRVRRNFPVVAHTLPPNAPFDGLLGLDFLRRNRLAIDFRRGKISLT